MYYGLQGVVMEWDKNGGAEALESLPAQCASPFPSGAQGSSGMARICWNAWVGIRNQPDGFTTAAAFYTGW
jgi:hypothetical protein